MKLQLLPFWWMSEKDIRTIKTRHVISYESAWNEGETLWQLFKRIFFFWQKSWDPSALLGFMLFGSRNQQEIRMAYIRHRFQKAFAIDTLSGNVQNAKEYELTETSSANWDTIEKRFELKGNLCVDLWHIRGNSTLLTNCVNALGKINRVVNYEGDCKIKLIHFQTRSKQEFQYFLYKNDYDSFLMRALLTLKKGGSVAPIIIELKPYSRITILRIADKLINLVTEDDC